jgi:hypothetical protein
VLEASLDAGEPLDQSFAPVCEAYPKVIHALWLQGRDAAPAMVRANLARWEKLNPDYELRVLDERDADALLAGKGYEDAHFWDAAKSDIVRLELLGQTGGFWVDATVFPVLPLSQWVDRIESPQGFFAFSSPGWDRPLSSWFLAASRGNRIIARWLAETRRFWREESGRRPEFGTPRDPVAEVAPGAGKARRRYPYYWVHYLFAYLLADQPGFRAAWDDCPRMAANEPHALLRRLSKDARIADASLQALLEQSPLHKLDWRIPLHPSFLRRAQAYPDHPQGFAERMLHPIQDEAAWLLQSCTRAAKARAKAVLRRD